MPYDNKIQSEGRTTDNGRAAYEAVRYASRDCPICEGQGICTVYHRTYQGEPAGEDDYGRVRPLVVGAHCRCELGKYIRAHTDVGVSTRIPTVELITQGRSEWELEPPGSENDCDYPDRPVDAESFAALRQRIAQGRIGKHWPANRSKHTHSEIAAQLAARKDRELQQTERASVVAAVEAPALG